MNSPSSFLLLLAIDGFPVVGPGAEAQHRRLIAAGLLAAFEAADDLGLATADADPQDEVLLLYRPDPLPAPAQVLSLAQRMFKAFHHWVARYQREQPCDCLVCRRATGLHLRILAHAGPLPFAAGHGAYGEAVWLLYDLLVDDARAHEHVLLTDPLLGAERDVAGSWDGAHRGTFSSRTQGEIGYVSVTLRDASELPPHLPAPVSSNPLINPLNPHWTQHLPDMPGRLALN